MQMAYYHLWGWNVMEKNKCGKILVIRNPTKERSAFNALLTLEWLKKKKNLKCEGGFFFILSEIYNKLDWTESIYAILVFLIKDSTFEIVRKQNCKGHCLSNLNFDTLQMPNSRDYKMVLFLCLYSNVPQRIVTYF